MNIILISQCEKRALTETRRILDQFAERKGERTWQTPITQAGLDTLRRLLRQTARKNTAVACHWVRGLNHTELLWIVGNKNRFNAQGTVPTNATTKDILRAQDENDWHTAQDISLLAQMAALLHDLGKASVAFQARLKGKLAEKNQFRHEWVSLRLFLAFVGQDDDASWLARLANPSPQDDAAWLAPARYLRDGLDTNAPPPFATLPTQAPLAAALAWLIVTHHRLPSYPTYNDDGAQSWLGKRRTAFKTRELPSLLASVTHAWNEISTPANASTIAAYWQFANPAETLPIYQPKWRAQASKLATRLLQLQQQPHHQHHNKSAWLHNPYVMHISRLILMLADHHYSSLPPNASNRVKGDTTCTLYANTDAHSHPKQTLDEHLLGVARDAARIAYALPNWTQHLRHLNHPTLRKRSGNKAGGRFQWQDQAADAAQNMRQQAATHGAFIINMASTGCGKTLANARIMHALARDPAQGMRCTFALGLRTLTLQTGRSYRQDLQLSEDELAVRVGGSASRALFAFYEQQAERTGSASSQALLEENSHLIFEEDNAKSHGLLGIALANDSIRKLLLAPLLVCTIDHLMPATEAQRAGRQIAPMLRLMGADLVLDELDDFDLDDLPALTRLMHWAGLLGSRVLISSATLPPALVQGMFEAYRAGRTHYQRNRGNHATPTPHIACLWVDEFGAHSAPCTDTSSLLTTHTAFVQRRVSQLATQPVLRRAALLPLQIKAKEAAAIRAQFANHVHAAILQAHATHHEPDPITGQHVSFGLVRMANIEPLFDVALALFQRGAPAGTRIHLCVYHARFPLILRSAIEHRIDTALNRRQPQAVYALPEIRAAIDAHPQCQHIFVVLGSPVCEVGRDHDYDWAVVEPSSMRSLIQLAGRVQRHRQKPCISANVLVLETNLKHFEQPGKPAFIRPGFESSETMLASHNLHNVLHPQDYETISARPRIQCNDPLDGAGNMADLEHKRLTDVMLPSASPTASGRGAKPNPLNAACAWQYPDAALTWILPQQTPFREEKTPSETLLWLPDDNDDTQLIAHRIHSEASQGKPAIYTRESSRITTINLNQLLGTGIAPWGGEPDLRALLAEQQQAQNLPTLRQAAERFSTVDVPESTHGWRYHPCLGVSKKK